MKFMGWSWEDYLSVPLSVEYRIVEQLSKPRAPNAKRK